MNKLVLSRADKTGDAMLLALRTYKLPRDISNKLARLEEELMTAIFYTNKPILLEFDVEKPVIIYPPYYATINRNTEQLFPKLTIEIKYGYCGIYFKKIACVSPINYSFIGTLGLTMAINDCMEFFKEVCASELYEAFLEIAFEVMSMIKLERER